MRTAVGAAAPDPDEGGRSDRAQMHVIRKTWLGRLAQINRTHAWFCAVSLGAAAYLYSRGWATAALGVAYASWALVICIGLYVQRSAPILDGIEE